MVNLTAGTVWKLRAVLESSTRVAKVLFYFQSHRLNGIGQKMAGRDGKTDTRHAWHVCTDRFADSLIS